MNIEIALLCAHICLIIDAAEDKVNKQHLIFISHLKFKIMNLSYFPIFVRMKFIFLFIITFACKLKFKDVVHFSSDLISC